MSSKISLFILLFYAATLSAQQLTDTVHIDYTQYKGKLLVVNEYHSVRANDAVYEHIIKQIAAVCLPGDTINVLIEAPYSHACLANKYLGGDSSMHNYAQSSRRSGYYIKTLEGLPIHIVGVDFEYDMGRRGTDYTFFLNNMLRDLSNDNVPVDKLREYTTALKQDSVWHAPKNKKELIDFYTTEQAHHQQGSRAYTTICDLLFVLNANHYISSVKDRDRTTFRRLKEAGQLGLVRFRRNYNILIHGIIHTDPTNPRDLYGYMQNEESSPFKDNCFSIAQVYLDCTSAGDYFKQEKVKGSYSIFVKDGRSDEVLKQARANYSQLPANSVICTRKIDGLSIPEQQRIICWYVQSQTE